MPARALRQNTRERYGRALRQASESTNARKGIKTLAKSRNVFRVKSWSESTNARKGIKTETEPATETAAPRKGQNQQMPARALRPFLICLNPVLFIVSESTNARKGIKTLVIQ